MPMPDADKAELKELFAEAMAEGIAKFRSKAEEEAAKSQEQDSGSKGDKNDTGGDKGSGFSFAGFLLGQ